MIKDITGDAHRGQGKRFAIIEGQFHPQVSHALVTGACDVLRAAGVADEDITIVRVPGACEIPAVAQRLAQSQAFDGVICLGVVIRGATPHVDQVMQMATQGMARVAQQTGVPTIHGVVTADSLEQAVERAGGRHGNRGADAARTALVMADIMQQLETYAPHAKTHHCA